MIRVLGLRAFEVHGATQIPIGSLVVAFLGLPSRYLNINHKRELLGSLWVETALMHAIDASGRWSAEKERETVPEGVRDHKKKLGPSLRLHVPKK